MHFCSFTLITSRCELRIHENAVTFSGQVRLPCCCWALPSLWKKKFGSLWLTTTVCGSDRLNLMYCSRSKGNRPWHTSVFTLALIICGRDFYCAMTLYCVMVWVIKFQRCFVFLSWFEHVENSWLSGTGCRYWANIRFFKSTICAIKSNVHDSKYDDGSDCQNAEPSHHSIEEDLNTGCKFVQVVGVSFQFIFDSSVIPWTLETCIKYASKALRKATTKHN